MIKLIYVMSDLHGCYEKNLEMLEKISFSSNDKHIWERMDYNKPYFQDKYFVSGHSPTFFIGAKWKGRIYKNCHHIAIDCGVVYGEKLRCICLDNLTEYYV